MCERPSNATEQCTVFCMEPVALVDITTHSRALNTLTAYDDTSEMCTVHTPTVTQIRVPTIPG